MHKWAMAVVRYYHPEQAYKYGNQELGKEMR